MDSGVVKALNGDLESRKKLCSATDLGLDSAKYLDTLKRSAELGPVLATWLMRIAFISPSFFPFS